MVPIVCLYDEFTWSQIRVSMTNLHGRNFVFLQLIYMVTILCFYDEFTWSQFCGFTMNLHGCNFVFL